MIKPNKPKETSTTRLQLRSTLSRAAATAGNPQTREPFEPGADEVTSARRGTTGGVCRRQRLSRGLSDVSSPPRPRGGPRGVATAHCVPPMSREACGDDSDGLWRRPTRHLTAFVRRVPP